MAKTTLKSTPTTSPAPQSAVQMPLSRINYILLAAGAGIIVLGFYLMSMDKQFIDATQFSVSLHVAPIVVMLGFAEIIFAIMYRKK